MNSGSVASNSAREASSICCSLVLPSWRSSSAISAKADGASVPTPAPMTVPAAVAREKRGLRPCFGGGGDLNVSHREHRNGREAVDARNVEECRGDARKRIWMWWKEFRNPARPAPKATVFIV
jgi:hypothetical protein